MLEWHLNIGLFSQSFRSRPGHWPSEYQPQVFMSQKVRTSYEVCVVCILILNLLNLLVLHKALWNGSFLKSGKCNPTNPDCVRLEMTLIQTTQVSRSHCVRIYRDCRTLIIFLNFHQQLSSGTEEADRRVHQLWRRCRLHEGRSRGSQVRILQCSLSDSQNA